MTLKAAGRADFNQISINQFFDRNPSTQDQFYNALVAGHALTTRWSYTVPAARKAYVNSAMIRIYRVTAAGTGGTIQDYIQRGTSMLAYVEFGSTAINTVGDHDAMITGQPVLMLAGETLSGKTVDGSTGGSVEHALSATITEFDA